MSVDEEFAALEAAEPARRYELDEDDEDSKDIEPREDDGDREGPRLRAGDGRRRRGRERHAHPSTSRSMRTSSSFGLNGFVRYSSAPASNPSNTSAS